MNGYINLLEDLLDVTKEETGERFADALQHKTDKSIINWEASYKLEGLIKKEILKMLQKVRD